MSADKRMRLGFARTTPSPILTVPFALDVPSGGCSARRFLVLDRVSNPYDVPDVKANDGIREPLPWSQALVILVVYCYAMNSCTFQYPLCKYTQTLLFSHSVNVHRCFLFFISLRLDENCSWLNVIVVLHLSNSIRL